MNGRPASPRVTPKPTTSRSPKADLFISHGIAVPVLMMIGVAVAMTFIATRTRFGRYVFAMGGNPEAAELAGINTRRVTVMIFAIMGMLTAISAAITTARLNAATNAAGTYDEMFVIAAAVIGGTSFNGGVGTVAGAVLGALVMQSLRSGMVLMGVDTPLQNIVVGIVLVVAVWLDTLYRQQCQIGAIIMLDKATPLVEMEHIKLAFGGIHAVDDVSIDLYPGEVVGIVGHNGAGKSCLIKVLSGAYQRDSGTIRIDGKEANINNPRDAKTYGIETIYQTLAVADNVDAAANLFLGRELKTRYGTLDDVAMEAETRKIMGRLNPNFERFKTPVVALSGGQRQSVAIARAIYFNARILIMDEPTAALGPQETQQVGELIKQLKADGIGIYLISHDIHDVFDLSDRVAVMKNGRLVGTAKTTDVTKDEVLGIIILGKCPPSAVPGPGAIATA